MKYITVFEESGITVQSEGYTQCLVDVSLELGCLQSQIFLDPDDNDGEQHEIVSVYNQEGDLIPVATIYTEEQFARVRS